MVYSITWWLVKFHAARSVLWSKKKKERKEQDLHPIRFVNFQICQYFDSCVPATCLSYVYIVGLNSSVSLPKTGVWQNNGCTCTDVLIAGGCYTEREHSPKKEKTLAPIVILITINGRCLRLRENFDNV